MECMCRQDALVMLGTRGQYRPLRRAQSTAARAQQSHALHILTKTMCRLGALAMQVMQDQCLLSLPAPPTAACAQQ